MSPHGLPDWGLTGPKHVTYGLDDVGEAVARLGSPDVWDRRGDVMYQTDFRDGVAIGSLLAFGAGSAYALVNTRYMSGPYSVRFTTGAGAGAFTGLAMFQLPREASAFGWELWFSTFPAPGLFDIRMQVRHAGRLYYGAIHYTPAAQLLEYQSAPLVYTVLDPAVGLLLNEDLFHVAKLVVDPLKPEYVRFLLDHHVYDLDGIPLVDGGATPDESVQILFYMHTNAILPAKVWLDRMIFTVNEPVSQA